MREFISTVRIMRYLLFEPFHGAAGDMVTGSLLSLGADRETVADAMGSVVSDPSFSIVNRAGIQAIRVETHATKSSRTLEEVINRVKGARAPGPAIEMAERVFRRISNAEQSVHGTCAHFHEVGADDAIADVIGACTALYLLQPDGVAVTPITVGGGVVTGSHGTIPVPAPATMEILKDSGLACQAGCREDGELCTPTGAALLAEFVTINPERIGPVTVSAIGYGAGSRDSPGIPNVLRAVMLEKAVDPGTDSVDVLETNVDDVSGEIIGNAISVLMNAGARDASAIPCIMKKGRGGYLVRVICREEDSRRLAGIIASELGTLGVRCTPMVHRFIARRSIEMIGLEIRGTSIEVPVKCGWMGDQCYTIKAEFDAARTQADKLEIPVRELIRCIERRAWELHPGYVAGDSIGPGKSTERKS
jgi:pyridinium-3,5-bisthiocarboxylic acid mononucleotide nickel chelatase